MTITSPKIYLASDSTVQNYELDMYPQAGWGQKLPNYINLPIINKAIGGRSSKTFIEEGRLDTIEQTLAKGDYLFVQFGHNDATKSRPERYVSSEDFPDYIKKYITVCKDVGATCVLITPVARRNCDEHGEFRISFSSYRSAMIQLALENDCPLLDLGKATYEHLTTLSHEESKGLFMWIEPGQYPGDRYLYGLQDNTHLNGNGAEIFAKILVELIRAYTLDDRLDQIKDYISL